MSDHKRPNETDKPANKDGATDPNELPDGSGSDAGNSHTTEGGDDDQFQG